MKNPNDSTENDQISAFIDSGIYRFADSNAVFIDPVRVLNRSYTHFRVSPSAFYSRFFESKRSLENPSHDEIPSDTRKRKRKLKKKNKKPHLFNEREQVADQRHKEVRPVLLKAHEDLVKATELLAFMKNLRSDFASTPAQESKDSIMDCERSFIELGNLWQSPLYEITLHCNRRKQSESDATVDDQYIEQSLVPAFNNLVMNSTGGDMEAEFLDGRYIIPRDSGFYMSDMGQIHNLIPESGCGFNLIVIDPPWENGSAHQKSMYPTLPNRFFLTLPIKQLAHTQGALVALWVTNREKLRSFVEKELFPTWKVMYVTTFYWLKVKADGLLVSDLDLFHHRPYECLLLGYCQGQEMDSNYLSKLVPLMDSKIIMSIPGDFSRKPPVGDLLIEHAPSVKPGRFIELFARELNGGWISWGNEPLRFQESRYFSRTNP